jgi:hypothetical protein
MRRHGHSRASQDQRDPRRAREKVLRLQAEVERLEEAAAAQDGQRLAVGRRLVEGARPGERLAAWSVSR